MAQAMTDLGIVFNMPFPISALPRVTRPPRPVLIPRRRPASSARCGWRRRRSHRGAGIASDGSVCSAPCDAGCAQDASPPGDACRARRAPALSRPTPRLTSAARLRVRRGGPASHKVAHSGPRQPPAQLQGLTTVDQGGPCPSQGSILAHQPPGPAESPWRPSPRPTPRPCPSSLHALRARLATHLPTRPPGPI